MGASTGSGGNYAAPHPMDRVAGDPGRSGMVRSRPNRDYGGAAAYDHGPAPDHGRLSSRVTQRASLCGPATIPFLPGHVRRSLSPTVPNPFGPFPHAAAGFAWI